MEGIAQLRNRAKDAFKAAEGISLTFLPFVARAVCDALLAYPDVNAELRGEELVFKRYVNKFPLRSLRTRIPPDYSELEFRRASGKIGSNSSTGFPEGSSTRICLPPMPVTISLRK